MEKKLFLLSEAKIVADSNEFGELSGYANVSGILDRNGEIVEPGAYKNLDALVRDGFGAIGHDWYGLPIATIEEAREDSVGLYFRMSFHSTDDAQEARKVCQERLARGKTVGVSIGYMVTDASYETRDGQDVRVLKGLEVFEVSIVTVPANPVSLATDAKGAGTKFEDRYESALAAVKSFHKDAEKLKSLRETDGRKLSELNNARIEALAAECDGLSASLRSLKDGLPDPADIEAVHRAMAKEIARKAQLPV
jgi:HK97 family phage prohead protease